MQKQLAEILNCAQFVISDRLKGLGKIYKEGKWISYELTPRDIERQKTISEILLVMHQRKRFLHCIVWERKMDLFSQSQTSKNHL